MSKPAVVSADDAGKQYTTIQTSGLALTPQESTQRTQLASSPKSGFTEETESMPAKS